MIYAMLRKEQSIAERLVQLVKVKLIEWQLYE